MSQWQSRGLGLKVKQVHGKTSSCQLLNVGQIEIGKLAHKDQFARVLTLTVKDYEEE